MSESITVNITEYTSQGVGGVSTFTALTDTPASYTGQSGKVAAVNVGEDGLEFIAVSGTGTVTSVAMTVPTGLAVSGSPITASGTLAVTLASGYVIPTQTALDGKVNTSTTVNGSPLSGNVTVTTITGNAGTVTTIGDLTGPVTSTNRATAIANNALSIAMTNGLQTALDGKQATLVSTENIRTVNGNTLLGSTDLVISGGVSTFLALTDVTPANYTGQAGKLVKVNPTEDALIFGDPSGSSVSWGDITGTIASQTDLTPANIGAAAASHTHTASNVTDFESAVTANASVTANTAKVTNQTHTGDVTGATALTIANDAVTTAKILDANVTLAKMADLSDETRLIGRGQGAFGGVPQEITLGTGLAMTGTALSVNASDANTNNTVVLRDGTGSFAAESVTLNSLTTTAATINGVSTFGGSATWSYASGRAVVHREALQVFETIGIACSDMTTVLTTGEKVAFDMPFDFSVRRIYASLAIAPTSSALTLIVRDETVNILEAASLSIAVSTNNAETSSFSGGASHALTKGDRVTIDIFSVGLTHAGLIVFLEGYRS